MSMEMDARAQVTRTRAQQGREVGQGVELDEDTAVGIEVQELDGRRWTHRYGPHGDAAWPAKGRPPHQRVRAITVSTREGERTVHRASDMAIVEGSFSCCDDALVLVTEESTLTHEALAQMLHDAYGETFATHRSAMNAREREAMEEHREAHADIAALAAGEALARDADEAQRSRIATLWAQTIGRPKGAVEDGVYTVTVANGAVEVERTARAMSSAPRTGERIRVQSAHRGTRWWTDAVWDADSAAFVSDDGHANELAFACGWARTP